MKYIILSLIFATSLCARDGYIFNDVAPVSIHFRQSSCDGSQMCVVNTSKEILFDITMSNVINGVKVSVVLQTIQPVGKRSMHGASLLAILKKLGLKPDGSGVEGSGLTVTCKYYSKPTPVSGWWEGELKFK